MSVKKSDSAPRNKAAKAVLLAAAAAISYTIAFTILYNSCHSMPERVFMIVFGLLVTLSAAIRMGILVDVLTPSRL